MKIIKKLILLASGEGSNVENIIKHFELNSNIEVVLVAGNNKKAYVFERVKKYDIDTFVFDKNFFDKKFGAKYFEIFRFPFWSISRNPIKKKLQNEISKKKKNCNFGWWNWPIFSIID